MLNVPSSQTLHSLLLVSNLIRRWSRDWLLIDGLYRSGKMEKNIGFSAINAQPSSMLPTAPPSYEDAIATGVPVNPPVGSASLGTTPMPMPYNQPPHQITMPITSVSSQSTSQPHFNAEPNSVPSVPRPEVRIFHHHLVYALASNPVKMACPTCHADIKTTTISDHQPSAHICCIVLCLLGCCLCSCLPYYMSAFMNVHHFCPNCKNYIGTWKGWSHKSYTRSHLLHTPASCSFIKNNNKEESQECKFVIFYSSKRKDHRVTLCKEEIICWSYILNGLGCCMSFRLMWKIKVIMIKQASI